MRRNIRFREPFESLLVHKKIGTQSASIPWFLINKKKVGMCEEGSGESCLCFPRSPPDLPRTLEKFTTRPRALRTSGRKVLVTSIVPQRLTSAVRLNCSSGVHSTGPRYAIPALFTRPHNPDDRETTQITQTMWCLLVSELICADRTTRYCYLKL